MHSPIPFLCIYRQILQLPQLPVRPEPPPVFFGAATTCAGSVAVALYSACHINKQHEHIDIVCSYFSRTHSHILHTLVFSLTYRYIVAQLARRKPREPDVRVKGGGCCFIQSRMELVCENFNHMCHPLFHLHNSSPMPSSWFDP